MIKLLVLCDYKGHFGSKYTANPYRSGMDKELLRHFFKDAGYKPEFMAFHDIDFRKNYQNQFVIYTSSEDTGNRYKSYIEDVVYGLELAGAVVIPEFKYLRATNNKVMMEILRDICQFDEIKNILSYHFGCFEEFKKENPPIQDYVYKTASGAQSKGVGKGKGERLSNLIRKISRSRSIHYDIKDFLRKYKHPGYIPDSRYRNKFIIQPFIKGLDNDYKVLVFGKKYYVLKRNNRNNDFRASGSGKFIFIETIPLQILDFAAKIFNNFNVPNISLDIAFNGENLYLLEYQCVYFGSTAIEKSPFYFLNQNGKWECIKAKSILEKVYAESLIQYVNSHM